METFSTKKGKLNYTIHNPNTVDDTANYLLKVLIEANEGKVEMAIQNNVNLKQVQTVNINKHFI